MYTVVARVTYPGTVRGWMLERFTSLVQVLQAGGLTFARALPVARAVLALWAQETNFGREEDNLNAANLHVGSGVPDVGPGWDGARVQRRDGDGMAWFRAYGTPRDAAIDAVDFLRSPRYRAAWNGLVRAPDDASRWYEALLSPPDGGAGYHPYSASSVWDYINIFEQTPRRFTQAEG